MPRKTRQQKILAELRTLRSQIQVPQEQSSLEEETQSPKVESISKSRLTTLLNTPVSSIQSKTSALTYDYVFRDLRKVALLATIALLIEVVLSLTLNFGFANLLKGLVGR